MGTNRLNEGEAVPRAYIELAQTRILHRTNEITQPRWRQDDCYKLIVGTKGAVSYETPQSRIKVRTGQFLLINPGDKHQQLSCTGDKFLVEFSPKLVNEVAREVLGAMAVDVRFPSILTFHDELVRLAKAWIPELYADLPGKRILLENVTLQWLVLAVRSVRFGNSDVTPNPNVHGIRKAIQMMMECHGDPLTLEDIARCAGMSKFSLIRHFKDSQGVTPYEWLQKYRLQRVCEDLVGTRRTVLDIALDHGFASLSTLNRQFLQLHGMTPTQWRSLHQ